MIDSSTPFLEQVNQLCGQQIQICYHCHTCTAGCPLMEEMEYGPDRLLRLIELGFQERALSSPDVWLCTGCKTCTARCPNGIDVSKVIYTLRRLSRAEGFAPALPNIFLFHRLFLGVVRRLGRSSEGLLIGLYKIRSRDFASDLKSGLLLFLRGKIPLIPKRIKNIQGLTRVVEAAVEEDLRSFEKTRQGASIGMSLEKT